MTLSKDGWVNVIHHSFLRPTAFFSSSSLLYTHAWLHTHIQFLTKTLHAHTHIYIATAMVVVVSVVMIGRQLRQSVSSPNFLTLFLIHVISRKCSQSMTETIASSPNMTALFKYIFAFEAISLCARTTWLAAQTTPSFVPWILPKILDLPTIHKRTRSSCCQE
jgi:FtsH-binding integral membrane protein